MLITFIEIYKHHLIKDAYIEKYEILVMELDINLNNKELNKKLN